MQERQIASQFLKELNDFRKDPRSIIQHLSLRKKHINSDGVYFPKKYPEQAMQTQQGEKPIEQLVKTLLETEPMKQLIQNQVLADLAKRLSKTFAFNPDQVQLKDGAFQLLRKQLDKNNQYDFNNKVLCMVKMCFDQQPYDPLISLLIDDGGLVYGRKNRQIILNKQLQFVGIGSTQMPDSQSIRCTVYLLTNSVSKK